MSYHFLTFLNILRQFLTFLTFLGGVEQFKWKKTEVPFGKAREVVGLRYPEMKKS